MNIRQTKKNNVKEEEKEEPFSKTVYVGGKPYKITDRRVWSHYQAAQKLVTNEGSIIGWR
jgi:hypothetical protein